MLPPVRHITVLAFPGFMATGHIFLPLMLYTTATRWWVCDDLWPAVDAVLERVKWDGCEPDIIVVLGHSFGCGTAILVADMIRSYRPFLVCISPVVMDAAEWIDPDYSGVRVLSPWVVSTVVMARKIPPDILHLLFLGACPLRYTNKKMYPKSTILDGSSSR